MYETTSQASPWYWATSITERLAMLRESSALNQPVSDPERAARRLARWRDQYADAVDFPDRLAADGIAIDELEALLGEPRTSEHVADLAPWAQRLEQAFADHTASPLPPMPATVRDQPEAQFLALIAPVVNQARASVVDAMEYLIARYPSAPLDPRTMDEVLVGSIPWQSLLTMVNQTLVLEMHVARLQDQLGGTTAEERFRSFVARLRQPEVAWELLSEYPVLARQLVECLDRWAVATLECVGRLCADWDDLQAHFSPSHPAGIVTDIRSDVGDYHRQGRSVHIIAFDGGLRLVYKPRSLAIDRHFQELLAWLNARGNYPPFRTLTVLDRGDYGWIEFVQPHGCATRAEVRRFYERQGGYLAVLYALEGTDIHYENIIAAGEHPVLIDLESLFHARMDDPPADPIDALIVERVEHSVLRIGLLPQRLWADGTYTGIDVSGLGMLGEQALPNKVLAWADGGTDEMRAYRKAATMAVGQNRPTLNSAPVDVAQNTDAVVAGFTTVYRLLARLRDELLAPDGPIARFATAEVRVVLRPTQVYAQILRESFHPDLLRDGLERDRFLDRLWVGVKHRPLLRRVVAAERSDIQHLDVPHFTTRVDARDVWTSTGERIDGVLDESGMALVRRRLQHMDENDLAQQRWFVRASLLALVMEGAPQPRYERTTSHVPVERERLILAARAAADRLQTIALRGADTTTWFGVRYETSRGWNIEPLGHDLYDGLSGIILFYAYLGHVTGEARYTQLARMTLNTLRRQVEQSVGAMTEIGAFHGWGGIIYLLAHLGALWNEPALLEEARGLVGLLPPLIAQDKDLDIIRGAAGCIGGLIALDHIAAYAPARAVAIACGDHLLATAQHTHAGIGWASSTAPQPAAGFSHGASGYAWALLELGRLTHEPRFIEAARQAIAHERTLFEPEAQNWRDIYHLIDPNFPDPHKVAWCHGAPGIGLGRIHATAFFDDPAIAAEIDIALQTTLRDGFGLSHCLCHGDVGNIEVLVQAGKRFGTSEWRMEIERTTGMILESIGRNGWLYGVPLGVEVPSLMTGLAGIGYGLLRLAEPQRIPSVLLLEPPCV